MNSSTDSRREIAEESEADAAVTLLRQVEEERGRTLSEAEYQEIRRSIFQELAHGAQCKPFTLVTFTLVGLLLLGLLVVGLVTAAGNAAVDYALAVVSAAGLAVWAFVFWSYFHGIRRDALRSLNERLSELERLREMRLLSLEEYEQIRVSILSSRQRSREV